MAPKPLIAGNWKMNTDRASGVALAEALGEAAKEIAGADMVICPPALYLEAAGVAVKGSSVSLGAQDCHTTESGAHTGDISANMLADIGCTFVIVGHSERRADHGESDVLVKAKAEAARAAGLTPIVCVGETEAERDAGKALEVVESQIRGSVPPGLDGSTLVVAYEPVWAIGTGRTPTVADVEAMHAHMRKVMADLSSDAENVRLLYGGSVKPGNAKELMGVTNVDGALVGGASLKAEDFIAIAESV